MTIREFYNACENFKHSHPSLMIYESVKDFDEANSNWFAYSYIDIEEMPADIWDCKVGKFEFTSYALIIAIDTSTKA